MDQSYGGIFFHQQRSITFKGTSVSQSKTPFAPSHPQLSALEDLIYGKLHLPYLNWCFPLQKFIALNTVILP